MKFKEYQDPGSINSFKKKKEDLKNRDIKTQNETLTSANENLQIEQDEL